MKATVAIVYTEFDIESVESLKAAIQTDGAKCLQITGPDMRATLRKIMDLDPGTHVLCIFCDNNGRMVSSLSAALDPRIPAVVWCREGGRAQQLAELLQDVPVLISFAESAGMVARLCSPIVHGAAPITHTQQEPAHGHPEVLPIAPAPNAEISAPSYDEDRAVYQQLETMMSSPVKDMPKPQPVQVQRPGLDFSTPLRKLMSHGRNIAQKNSAPEVLGVHYLAALEPPYTEVLEAAGLTRQLIDDYLGGFTSAEQIAVDPIVSDEAFDAVSRAKSRARKRNGSCIQTADFLAALAEQAEGSVADIISAGDIHPGALSNEISKLNELSEPCAAPFFAPSSLDQDSFYEFDPAQVRTVEERLRTLPGFQKAAARVAEARHAGHSTGAPATPAMAAVSAMAAEPPEKPEIIRVSAVFPSVDEIEHIADSLLEGQVIAFPSDTMYALAADAANPAAVERLRQTADLTPEKPLSILINSTTQLKHLVRADLDALEQLFDELWPGPLTLVFKSAGSIARHITSGSTIAIRQPGDNTSLAILSMVGRPLAVTSWDATPANEPVDVTQLAEELSGKAAIVVTHGEPVPQVRTTVINTTTAPWEVIREGAVPAEDVLRHYPS